MTSKDICELKSIRTDVVEKISHNMKEDDIIQSTCDLFKILGDANRVKIILALQYEELCVCELSLLLDMSQSSVSHQLRHLRQKNIVKFRKENKKIFYSLIDSDILNIIKEGEKYAN